MIRAILCRLGVLGVYIYWDTANLESPAPCSAAMSVIQGLALFCLEKCIDDHWRILF